MRRRVKKPWQLELEGELAGDDELPEAPKVPGFFLILWIPFDGITLKCLLRMMVFAIVFALKDSLPHSSHVALS